MLSWVSFHHDNLSTRFILVIVSIDGQFIKQLIYMHMITVLRSERWGIFDHHGPGFGASQGEKGEEEATGLWPLVHGPCGRFPDDLGCEWVSGYEWPPPEKAQEVRDEAHTEVDICTCTHICGRVSFICVCFVYRFMMLFKHLLVCIYAYTWTCMDLFVYLCIDLWIK